MALVISTLQPAEAAPAVPGHAAAPSVSIPTGGAGSAAARSLVTPGVPVPSAVAAGPVTSGETGTCLDDAGGSGTAGTAIGIAPCAGTAEQTWTLETDGTLRIAGGCAATAGGALTNGTLFVLEPCSSQSAAQTFRAGVHSELVNTASGKCLDDTGGATAAGTRVSLATCAASVEQEWGLPANVSGYVTDGVTGKCMDDTLNSAANGTAVQIWSCNGNPQQQWTVADGWAIEVNGACLEPSGAGTAQNTVLVLEACAATTAQDWAAGPDGWLWNVNAAKCASDPNAATTNGTQLIIAGCASPLNTQQTWRVPTALPTAGALTSGVSGECAANAGGTKAVIAGCVGTGPQIWVVSYNGTIVTHDGLCAALTGGATASGTLVALATCTGAAAQHWAVGPAGAWVTAVATGANQYCLTDPSNSTTGQTQLDIAACSGATGQTWTLPLTTLPSPPVEVTAVPSHGQAVVSWVAPWSNGGATITGFGVAVTSSGASVPSVNGLTGLSTTITGLTDGTSYTFRVNASTAVGTSALSSPSAAVTPEPAPLTPLASSMSPQYWATDGNLYTSSATPAFSATATDPAGLAVAYNFEILSGTAVVATGTTAAAASGTPATWAGTTALANGTNYSYQVRAFDGTQYGPWSLNRPFTVQTGTPAAVTISCSGYPSGTWSAQVSGGSTTCSWTAPLSHMNGYSWGIDGTWSWTTGTSVTIDPGPGEHTVSVIPQSGAGLWGAQANDSFGVGMTGAMLAPADGSQTSTTVALQAAAPTGYTSATFQYREGTTGGFTQIPGATVVSCGCAVTWPVSTSAGTVGVQTALMTWFVTRTVTDDGPVQIQAVFTNASGATDTTPPVTVTLDRVGTGADYGTTTAGPVTVGLQSGNAALTASDVSIASYGSSLDVSRTFNSVAPAAPSIFGPGWTTSLTGGVTTAWTQLTVTGTYAALQAADGTSDTFIQGSTSGSTVTWTPQGDAVSSGLTLTQNTSGGTFTLTDSSNTVTVFSQARSTAPYLPTTVTVPGDSSSAGFVYDGTSTDASYGDPVLMVAPDAASSAASTTACPYPASAATWTAGCRGLQFTYNTAGHVTEIDFAYVNNAGTFHTTAVADYGYDSSGRLTSEWDPRLDTPLVTGYTYEESTGASDYGRITQISPAQAAGSGTLAPWTFTYDDTASTVNFGNLLTVSRIHSAADGGGTATTTIDYSVPLTTAAGGPINMDAGTVAAWAQTDPPASAVAIFPPSHMPSSPPTAADYQYARIDYYDASGQEVNTASYINGAWAVTTTQYDAYGNNIWTLTAANRAAALAASDPAGNAISLASVNVYGCDNFGTVGACTNSDQQYRVVTDTYGPAHNASVDGTVQLIRTHTAYSYDAGAPSSDTNAAGSPYMQTTSQTDSASVGNGIPGTATADPRTTSYTYGNSSTNIGWTLGAPLTTVTDPSGLDLVSTSVFNTSSSLYGGANLQTDSYLPSATGGGGAGDTQTVYYTAGTNPTVAACGNKPEWTDLTCQTGPAAQPGTTGLPNIPVSTYTYDDFLNVITKTETFGTTGTRVTATGYDGDERPITQTITVTGTGMGTAVPETRTVYSVTSGLPTDTQTLDSSGVVTADINATYDDFGNHLTYTDASGNTTTYTYDIASRVTSRNDGQGTQTISYAGSFGTPTQLIDSQAGTFTATYDPDGSVATETYPGGLTGTYTSDPTGTATSLSYSGQSWPTSAPLTETIVPNAIGDWASRSITDAGTSLVSSQAYSYDTADRLAAVQDTLAGQCTTRAYGYNTDSNRTSLITYAPNSDGTCQTGTGVTTTEAYDSADRSTNSGYAYDTQGDITTTPSADAGGNSNLTAAYYANDMLGSQTQNGATMTWALDPTQGRFSSSSQSGVTLTNHYGDTSNSPIWVSDTNGGWTRNVDNPTGLLAAQVTSSGTTLELPDLHGDVMATAATSSTSAGPVATYVYTEFGAVESGTPGTYGWLGGKQISNNALGGQLLMGARAYNPNTGRFSQVDPVPGGSANAYDYALQNPLTGNDPSGRLTCSSVSGSVAERHCWSYVSERDVKWLERHTAYVWASAGGCALASFKLAPGLMDLCILIGAIAGILSGEVGPDDHGYGEWLNISEQRWVVYYPDGITWYGEVTFGRWDSPWWYSWLWFTAAY